MKKLPLPSSLLQTWLPWVLALVLVAAHVGLSIFWRGHDTYDDTGYMLSILRGVQDGGVLYREVFTQYGPFHTQAWLAMLGLFGWPVDHNHAGLIVALLWMGSALAVAAWSYLLTRSSWWAAGMACWAAWSLADLSAELAHPVSLGVLLTVVVLCAGMTGKGKVGLTLSAVGGAAVAALLLMKINLGIFSGVAVGLALFIAWTRGGKLALLAAAGSLVLPFVLLTSAWPVLERCYLGSAVGLTSLMAARLWGAWRDETAMDWKAELTAWSAGFAVMALAILAVIMSQGVTLAELRAGMVTRPLGLSSVSRLYPPAMTWDHVAVIGSVLLAVAWHVPGLRTQKVFWHVAAGSAALFNLLRDPVEGQYWIVGPGALLWLALVAAEGRGLVHRRAVLLGVLLAAWQGLGVFPVNGAQAAVPRIITFGVWAAALYDALHGLAATLPQGRARLPLRVGGAVFFATLLYLGSQVAAQHRRGLDKNVPAGLKGMEWYCLPREQAPLLQGLVQNLKLAEGPVFTFHGQCSFSLWTGKPFVNGFNCTHLTAILTKAELEDTFAKFRAQPRWSALVFKEGRVFGEGPMFPEVNSFVRTQTTPWLRTADYEVRLSSGHPVPTPRHVVWKQDGVWQLSAPLSAMGKATKWRLHTEDAIRGSGRWSKPGPEVTGDADGYVQIPVPAEIVEVLEKNPAAASVSLCDRVWVPYAAVPVATLERQVGKAP